ncbi:MAG: OmpH family outer membrane protein [Sphingomicrobium sp.]
MTRTLILAAILSSATIATPAAAQVAGIATLSPVLAIGSSKALAGANQTILTQYKTTLDQIDAQYAAQQPLLIQLDKNKDNQIDEAEQKAARTAKGPAYTKLEAINKELQRLNTPITVARLFALESILQRYQAAQTKVITDRKVSMVLSPSTFIYAAPAVDITALVTAELDRTVPSVGIVAPANWRPSSQTVQVAEQLEQLGQVAAARAAAAQSAPTTAAPRPATAPATKPQGR